MKTSLLQLFPIILVLMLITACEKKTTEQLPTDRTMEDLNISSSFDWSTKKSGTLQVTINPLNAVSLSSYDNMVLDLMNTDGERISRQGIVDGMVTFDFTTSKAFSQLIILSPLTMEQKTVDINESETSFDLSFVELKNIMIDSDNDGVDDSVDDYPNDNTRAYRSSYHYWLVYEDLWPAKGDYDFNDLVIEAWVHEADNAQNQLVGGDNVVVIHTLGGSIPIGLGYRWFSATNGYNTLNYLSPGTVTFSGGGVVADPDVDNAVIVFNNAFEAQQSMSNGNTHYYANNGTGPTMIPDTIQFRYDFTGSSFNEWMTVYLFYTNDRGHEIHTFGNPPTAAADMSLFGTFADNSLTSWTEGSFNPPLNFYQTASHLPWGLELSFSNFKVPLEKVSIMEAYPQFADWAESSGSSNTGWGNNYDPTKVFDLDNEL